jgi:hypothetical protein
MEEPGVAHGDKPGQSWKGRIRTAAVRASGTIARDLLRRDAAQYLAPGEQIQVIFAAKRPGVQFNDRAVVATDRRLLLLKLNYFGSVTGLLGEAPRDTKLGPCSGFFHPIAAFGTPLGVNVRFFKDVAEADRAAGFQ